MLRSLLSLVIAMMAVPFAVMLAPAAANAASATTAACSDGVAVTQFSFNPGTIAPGQTSALTLVLQNCTGQTIQGSTVWFGRYAGQGCPVIDPPPPFRYTIAAWGTYTLSNTYGDLGGACQPTGLDITANVNVNGVTGTVTTVTASLVITSPQR